MSLRECSQCGLTYVPEEEEDRKLHRNRHAMVMRMVNHAYKPKPLKSFLKCIETEEWPEHVRMRSPRWKHKQMYYRARAFKKEFGYDFTQWGDGYEDDPNAHGILFHEEGVILGACAFRWRGDHWGMQWVWFAPQARRKGILTKWWPRFVKTFGNFELEYPLSDAMAEFAKKIGHIQDNENKGTMKVR